MLGPPPRRLSDIQASKFSPRTYPTRVTRGPAWPTLWGPVCPTGRPVYWHPCHWLIYGITGYTADNDEELAALMLAHDEDVGIEEPAEPHPRRECMPRTLPAQSIHDCKISIRWHDAKQTPRQLVFTVGQNPTVREEHGGRDQLSAIIQWQN
jgi:hypothetical protein